ncbi:hypothetical protein [Paraburkholderia sp. 35.1]|uniref:hypothetical protein n=1 Tax=Paraburkholderia sp. 35.1 TaxID=2991058 RepID=UPI003D25F9B8
MESDSTRPGTFLFIFLESVMQAQVETVKANTDEGVSPLETNFGDEQPLVTVPYSSLRPSPLNARTKPLSGSKARIADVVSAAVSLKAATDLNKMKKTDAAAAAELRLAKVAWLPEILTDREAPATPSRENRDDEDEDGADAGDTGNGADDTPEDEDVDAEPDAGNGTEHVNDTPADAEAAPVASSPLTSWPYPTSDSMDSAQSGPLVA